MTTRPLLRKAIAATAATMLLVALTGTGADARARPARPACRTPGTLVAANGVAVLSRATGPGIGSTIPGYWACSKGHRARVIGPAVGDTPEGGIPVPPDLEGRFVGWGDQTRTAHGCAGGVSSMALDTGKMVSNGLAAQCEQQTIISVRVTTTGVLAWSATLPDGTAQILRDDRHRRRTVLDSGAVDPRSLTVGGSTAFWLHAGTAASTTL